MAVPAIAQTRFGNDAPTVSLDLVVSLTGDLEIGAASYRDYGKIPQENVFAIIRQSLGCDWHPASYGADCRHLLSGDGDSVDGQLALDRVVRDLRKAGFTKVFISLRARGSSAGRPSSSVSRRGWTELPDPRGNTSSLYSRYYFWSAADDELPRVFTVRMGEPWKPERAAFALLFVTIIPAFLALGLRMRDGGSSGIVWLNWIITGLWLYWISAMRPTDILRFAARLQLAGPAGTLLVGVVTYAIPPLAAMAISTLILMPVHPEDGEAERRRTVLNLIMREGATIVPLGVFSVGSAMFRQSSSISILALPAAFILFQMLRWLAGLAQNNDIRILESGELLERARAIAASAGAKLNTVLLTGTRRAQSVNAAATSNGTILLTRGLVERLSRREVDAVIAHEAGHLSGKHIGYRQVLFWAYIIFVGPGAVYLIQRANLPPWLLSLPVLPFLYVFAAGQLSQKHEFSADAKAVALTGDPEGMIAALARLSMITRSPVDWGGMQGSILSHPSMKRRTLAIARSCDVSPERALEILRSPDAIETEPVPGDRKHYSLPPSATDTQPLFSPVARVNHLFWARWELRAVLVLVLAVLAFLADRLVHDWIRSQMLVLSCIPLAAWVYLRADDFTDMRFRRSLRRRLRARIQPSSDSIFVGIIPGALVLPFNGFYDWDLGFLTLSPDLLSYCGERARFSVSRADIADIRVLCGPAAWRRTYGVAVRTGGGTFILRRCDLGGSQRQARRLEARLKHWLIGLAEDASAAAPDQRYPEPNLPELRFQQANRGTVALRIVTGGAMLFIGTALIVPALNYERIPAILRLLPVTSACAYVLASAPVLLRKRQPKSAPV